MIAPSFVHLFAGSISYKPPPGGGPMSGAAAPSPAAPGPASLEGLLSEKSALEGERDLLSKAESVEAKSSERYPRIALALAAAEKDLRRIKVHVEMCRQERSILSNDDAHLFPYGYRGGMRREEPADYAKILLYAEERAAHPLFKRVREDEGKAAQLKARLQGLTGLEELIRRMEPEDIDPAAVASEIGRIRERIAVLNRRIERNRLELERLSIGAGRSAV